MRVENTIRWLKSKIQYRHPPTYEEELDCQCRLFTIPGYIMAWFLWLPYIPLDISLYPEVPLLVWFRWGFTAVGILATIIHLAPFIKTISPKLAKFKHYFIFAMILGYLQISTGLIMGLVRGDSTYLGGYCLIILLLPIVPLKVKHTMSMLIASLITFLVVGLSRGMEFHSARQLYGLFNVIVAVLIATFGFTLLSLIRRNSYSNNLIIQERADEKIDDFFKEKGISKREGEIVRLIIAGKSNNEIEQKLFISLTTVKSHIYKAYQKFGIKNRVQLIHLLENIKKRV